jgi:hypothetical protein
MRSIAARVDSEMSGFSNEAMNKSRHTAISDANDSAPAADDFRVLCADAGTAVNYPRACVRVYCAADEFGAGAVVGADSGGAVLAAAVAIRVGVDWPVLLELAINKSRVSTVACGEAGTAVVNKRAAGDLELRALGDRAADACAAPDFAAADQSSYSFEHDVGTRSAGRFRPRELEHAGANGDADWRVHVAAIAEIVAPSPPSLSQLRISCTCRRRRLESTQSESTA